MKTRIHLREPFFVALETLRAHKMRSFLMLLGIVLSVSTLIMVVALISGVNLYVTNRIANCKTAVTVESAWCSAFAVRVDGSRRSAARARRCTSARASGRAIASSSHIRRRLEKNAHMFRVPSSSPRGALATRPVPG